VVGTVEFLSIIGDKLALAGPFWDWIGGLNFEVLGTIIIGIFVVSWAASTLIYKLRGYDKIEARVGADD
jgi:high-affinity nickel-transport protein